MFGEEKFLLNSDFTDISIFARQMLQVQQTFRWTGLVIFWSQHWAISASLTDLVQCHQQCPLTGRNEPCQSMGRGLVCTSVGLGSCYVFKVFIQIFTKMLTGRKTINGIVMAVYRMRGRETMKHKNRKMLAIDVSGISWLKSIAQAVNTSPCREKGNGVAGASVTQVVNRGMAETERGWPTLFWSLCHNL